MIIMLKAASTDQINRVIDKIRQCGIEPYCLNTPDKTIIMSSGDPESLNLEQIKGLAGVDRVVSVQAPFKMVSREFRPENTVVVVGDVEFGGNAVPIIAGPCAVESYEQIRDTALAAIAAGAAMLRGGAYKPRTSPYSFQGLEKEGLEILRAVSRETGLPVVSEVIDPRAVEEMARHVAMLQIGARNMQNFALLKEVAIMKLPVLLKRGSAATIEEWLMAAEYIVSGGNGQVVLCERGIRTFEPYTRNTLDLNAVPVIKRLSHLPVIVDPSHGTGIWWLIDPMAKAAVAAGADGLIVEIHPCPGEAVSDGHQSLSLVNFSQLMTELTVLVDAVGRRMYIK